MADSDPFMGDAGPAFDPKAAAEQPPPEPAGATLHALPDLAPEWQADQVANVLRAQGTVTHALVGVGETDWKYLDHELVAISAPLARILNRYDATRAAAGTADELGVIIGLSGYATRSYRERRAALAAEADLPPAPASGVTAPPGTGPPAQEAPAAEPAFDQVEDLAAHDPLEEEPEWTEPE